MFRRSTVLYVPDGASEGALLWFRRSPFLQRGAWQASASGGDSVVQQQDGQLVLRAPPKAGFASMADTLSALIHYIGVGPAPYTLQQLVYVSSVLDTRGLPWAEIRRYQCLLVDYMVASDGGVPRDPLNQRFLDVLAINSALSFKSAVLGAPAGAAAPVARPAGPDDACDQHPGMTAASHRRKDCAEFPWRTSAQVASRRQKRRRYRQRRQQQFRAQPQATRQPATAAPLQQHLWQHPPGFGGFQPGSAGMPK